ncbi:hypothetical protein KSF_088460 [Reticulibacter mediterranei]|uniref:Uncharacterized protein n=1 Tax=Reticulibacter mediterranei TaxID=2778369 RepID=A0A8J3N7N4_9CHLR|nr:hypothetical protein [Reticulibacter mediterranei]GHO98798.1 hypothetical protein KSF_088460 [Reticulibacter mediterranei]
MANPIHLPFSTQRGVESWNQWRLIQMTAARDEQGWHKPVYTDLSGTDLSGANIVSQMRRKPSAWSVICKYRPEVSIWCSK